MLSVLLTIALTATAGLFAVAAIGMRRIGRLTDNRDRRVEGPRVSVVLAARDEARHLGATLDTLRAQTYLTRDRRRRRSIVRRHRRDCRRRRSRRRADSGRPRRVAAGGLAWEEPRASGGRCTDARRAPVVYRRGRAVFTGNHRGRRRDRRGRRAGPSCGTSDDYLALAGCPLVDRRLRDVLSAIHASLARARSVERRVNRHRRVQPGPRAAACGPSAVTSRSGCGQTTT